MPCNTNVGIADDAAVSWDRFVDMLDLVKRQRRGGLEAVIYLRSVIDHE